MHSGIFGGLKRVELANFLPSHFQDSLFSDLLMHFLICHLSKVVWTLTIESNKSFLLLHVYVHVIMMWRQSMAEDSKRVKEWR